MNRSLKLSMLIALALGSSQVMAVDLGQIRVKSALGQPLLAEIPLHPESPAELQGLTVQLASSDEFARAGIVGGRTAVPLHFSVATVGAGQPVIRITSSTPVGDPFLDLLIEVNGKAGRSVREYAILLDPPNGPQAAPVATTAAPSAPYPRVTRPAKAAEAPATKTAAPAKPAKAAVAKAAPAPASVEAGNGQTAPIERGQTLSSIARSVTPAGVDVQQMMLALQQANPNAFYRNNINALKTGVVLRVPTSAEAQAMTIAAAVAEVRRQNSDWRAGTPGKPAVVANAAARTSSAGASTGAPDTGDRLALMPAKANTGAGSQSGGAAGNGARQELLRTKESLASLQQQTTDLKARVKDLADINSKNERLLSLKDNQIAELQAKLAAARKAANQPAAASPAAAASNTKATGAVPAAPVEKLETATASTAASVAAAPVAATAAAASTPARAPAHASTVMTTPIATSTLAKPVEKPVATPPAHAPAPLEQPWYMHTWAWAAAGGAIVLLILLAMLGRRRKPAAEASKVPPSLANRFGSTAASAQDFPGGDVDQDELLDQLAEHPDDISLHLELVTLYYSRRDVEHFEAAAEAMHAHIVDPQQDEWQDVLHMGEDLAPGHPLFDHHAEPALSGEAEARGAFNIDDYADKGDAPTVVSAPPPLPPSGSKPVSEYNFNFDLTRTAGETAARPAPTAAPAGDDATVVAPLASSRPAPTEPVSSWHFEEDDSMPLAADAGHDLSEFNDDPVDTKLDLARAYIDMGDAEGARAMLDEVAKEGSQMQKDAAKRLLDSLH